MYPSTSKNNPPVLPPEEMDADEFDMDPEDLVTEKDSLLAELALIRYKMMDGWEVEITEWVGLILSIGVVARHPDLSPDQRQLLEQMQVATRKIIDYLRATEEPLTLDLLRGWYIPTMLCMAALNDPGALGEIALLEQHGIDPRNGPLTPIPTPHNTGQFMYDE